MGAVINSILLLITPYLRFLDRPTLPIGEYSDCRTYFQRVATLSMAGIPAALPLHRNGGVFDQV